MQGLLERMGEKVLDRVKLNCRVKKIRSENEERRHFVVETDTEESFLCDYVILTVSLGVLKLEAESLFDPPLPRSKLNVIEIFGFGTVAKVFLEFPGNVQEIRPDMKSSGVNFLRRGDSCSIPWRNEECDPWVDGVMGVYPTRGNPRVLVVWVSGPAAVKVETMSESGLIEDFHHLLSKFLGPMVPPPVSARVTDWGLNPLTRGSYSFLSLSSLPHSQSVLAAPLGRLLFAGEATHSAFFSSVHGALESGWREAERIISWKKAEK